MNKKLENDISKFLSEKTQEENGKKAFLDYVSKHVDDSTIIFISYLGDGKNPILCTRGENDDFLIMALLEQSVDVVDICRSKKEEKENEQ